MLLCGAGFVCVRCVWRVYLSGLGGLCGMHKCIWSDTQKHVQLPAAHKIPRGLTQLRADLGPQGTPKSFREPWSVQGHHHWPEPQGEPFLETEGNTLQAGVSRLGSLRGEYKGPTGDLEEDSSLEEGQAQGGA